jgi:hypothetical protein
VERVQVKIKELFNYQEKMFHQLLVEEIFSMS